MLLKDVRIEYREHPLGLDELRPRFSWKLESDRKDTVQTAYEIQVICEGRMVWASGAVESDQSVLVEYGGLPLAACQIYQYRISVRDNHGETASADGSFETGLLAGTNFTAEWISYPKEGGEFNCPVFRKEVQVKRQIAKARVYATALGVYELQINGKKAGDAFLAPGWTNYHKRLQYQTYDVTNLLQKDVNLLEITAANGWYKGIFGFTCTPNHYGDQLAVLAELHITYEDGSREIIGTGPDWTVTTGQIRYSEIYMGETIDSTWQPEKPVPAVPFAYSKKHIIAQESEPVRVTQRMPARELIVTPKGEQVLDFGQNMAGLVEVRVQGKPGQEIRIRHAETLDRDGNFYPETLRSAKSIDTYICDGSEQIFMPHFTFHGFRYICVEGLEVVKPENFTVCAMHTDMKQTGSFRCSHPLVNQLQSNIAWGQRSNFLDVPTDCPQRDERLGWTGDAQVFARTACFNHETALFFRKWLHDLWSEQNMEFGPPHVVPNILGNQDGAAAWCDAATIIPWTVYQTYGDIRILRDQYQSMRDWVDYISQRCGENGLWQTGFQYGDWLALDKEESADRTGATDKYLVANAFYANSAELVSKAAEVLGLADDAKRYRLLHDRIVKAFQEEYITRTGRLVSETQTGCILTLHFRLAQEEYRQRIAKSLESNIVNHKNHLSTGFVGTPYLCHVLSENGMHDLAGTIFLKEDYPSWLYAVKQGATTIWERWNSIKPDGTFDESGMNSLNHYAYGSIGDWMYEKLAGIKPLRAGYKQIRIEPQFMKGITSVDASFDSPYGMIRSAWSCTGGRITVDVTIPANTSALLKLPEKDEPILTGSGSWHYEYDTETCLELDRYTMESGFGEILESELARKMLNDAVPGMLDDPMIEFSYGMTISELCAMMPAEMQEVFREVLFALNRQEQTGEKESEI